MSRFEHVPDGRTFIGGDVSKELIEFYNDARDTHEECVNRKEELLKLAETLVKVKPTMIVMEATGGYEQEAYEAFTEKGLNCVVVMPKRARDFIRGLGEMAKTDPIDAEALAYYGRINKKLRPKMKVPTEHNELRALTTRRRQLIENRVTEKNRLGTAHASARGSIKEHIEWLSSQIKLIEAEIRERIKADEAWQEKDKLLRSVPGVGPVLSASILTELPELGLVSGKKIAALVGVAPYPLDSGKYKGPRRCKGGRGAIRKVLYMAMLSAAKYNSVIRESYRKLCEKGKPKKLAMIAGVRKLIVILNAMIEKSAPWQAQN